MARAIADVVGDGGAPGDAGESLLQPRLQIVREQLGSCLPSARRSSADRPRMSASIS
jgi:hypothetical protein